MVLQNPSSLLAHVLFIYYYDFRKAADSKRIMACHKRHMCCRHRCPVCNFSDVSDQITFVHLLTKHPMEYITLKHAGLSKELMVTPTVDIVYDVVKDILNKKLKMQSAEKISTWNNEKNVTSISTKAKPSMVNKYVLTDSLNEKFVETNNKKVNFLQYDVDV